MHTWWCGCEPPNSPPPPHSSTSPDIALRHGGYSTHHCNGAPVPSVPTVPLATCIFPVCNPHPFSCVAGRAGGGGGAMPHPTGQDTLSPQPVANHPPPVPRNMHPPAR